MCFDQNTQKEWVTVGVKVGAVCALSTLLHDVTLQQLHLEGEG